jgi:hypothetical protein
MDARDNIAQDLFYKIRSRFSGLKLGAETGEITIMPNEARFFDFDYQEDSKAIGHVSISLAEPNSMKVYFSNGITEAMDGGQKTNWYKFLRELRNFAKRRLLAFDTRDIAKDNLDQRDYAFLSKTAQPKPADEDTIVKPVGESIMSESAMYGTKTVSYQKLMDTRLIIKHSQALQDDMAPGARSRNISALFVENQDGERFKYPFIHLAGARAMQRHVANGGVPYDEIGKSVIDMSEQIAQLRSFGNYVVRNDLMNSETNGIVERSSTALNDLREQVAKLAKQTHYEAYKENFQARTPLEVPNEVVEDFTEKFTVKNFKEDLKSVFPVLYRLMQEESTIGYDDIVDMTTNEDINDEAVIETSDINDEFDYFEQWVMNLGEASGITSEDDEERSMAVQNLQKLMNEEFPAGIDGSNAIESVKGIIEDPSLFKEIKDAAKEDPETDIRPLIRAWMEENAQDSLEEIDFGDTKLPGEDEVEENAGSSITKHTPYTPDQIRKYNKWAEQKGIPDYNPDHMFKGSVGDKMIFLGDKGTESVPVEVVSLDPNYQVGVKIRSLDGSDIPGYGEPETDIDWITGNDKVILKPMQGNEQPTEDDDRYSAKKSDIPAYQRKAKGGDDWKLTQKDLDKESERNISSKEYLRKQNNESMDVQELAEFISSFYDKNSGTFPKGPEGVCTMVGKKFGEQAEQVARKFVERMAPQQSTEQNPKLAELSRIRELSGISNTGVAEESGSYYHEKLAQEVFDENPDLDTSGRDPEVLDAVFPLLVRDLGSKKRASNLLSYDEDFPSDFVSAYGELKRNSSKQGSDTISNMFGGSADELTKGLKIRDNVNPELESIKKLSGISQGMGY